MLTYTIYFTVSLVLLVIFLGALFMFQVSPAQADDPQAEMVWVLTETQVNPYDGQLEFYGGGASPGWFGERVPDDN